MAKVIKHKCKFCTKEFVREETINTHACVKRDRYNLKDERASREAFSLFLKFHELNKIPMKKSAEPIMLFVCSKFYNDFYNFAKFIISTEILDKEGFIASVLMSKTAMHTWTTKETINNWTTDLIKNEPVHTAVTRSIEAMAEWGITTGNDWTEYFKKVSTDRAIFWFENGRVSPWIFYVCSSQAKQDLMGRFSARDIEYLKKFLDETYFSIKYIRYKDELTELSELISTYGI